MLGLRLYQLLSFLLWPLFRVILLRRLWAGKENSFRVKERRGFATQDRPDAPLIWFHGASVGETLSILPLANHFLTMFPRAELLITSGTTASADLIAARLPERARHQFLPMDHPAWVARFLDHWSPDVAIWAESEIWPNLIWGCKTRSIELHLANARMSLRSFDSWRRRARMARKLFGVFESIIAQTRLDADRFESLGGLDPVLGGNIKFAGGALPASKTEVDGWRAAFLDRPVWFAASTHPGEEALVLEVHLELKRRHPSLVTVIAPRHVERLPDLQDTLFRGHTHALYSEGPDMIAAHSILLVDQMGVLGPLYQACGVTLVAGSLVPNIGGHNPIEPARNGSAVIVGNYMDSQKDLVDIFLKSDALIQISDTESLIDVVDLLLCDTDRVTELQTKGRELVAEQSDVLRLYSNALLPKLEASVAKATK